MTQTQPQADIPQLAQMLAERLRQAQMQNETKFVTTLPLVDVMELQLALQREHELKPMQDFWILPRLNEQGVEQANRQISNKTGLEYLNLLPTKASMAMAQLAPILRPGKGETAPDPEAEAAKAIAKALKAEKKEVSLRERFRQIQAELLAAGENSGESCTLCFSSRAEAIKAANNWHSWPDKNQAITVRRTQAHELIFTHISNTGFREVY